MAPKARPFDDCVDRSGEHHLWSAAHKADGTGLVRIDGKLRMAPHVAWERAHGPVPEGFRVKKCAVAACVRVEHLELVPARKAGPVAKQRAARGNGSRVEVRPGVWKLTVSAGRYEDGSRRREHMLVKASTDSEAAALLGDFAAEVRNRVPLADKADRDIVVDDAVERYLEEYLEQSKGRERRTVDGYRNVHKVWGSPHIGRKRVRDVDEDDMDDVFGRMQRAGLSASRMNQARSVYKPMFQWAKRRRIVTRNVMVDFEMPRSIHATKELRVPEVEDVCLLLATAVEVIPDVAPVLTLAAVTGMRRGELTPIRRTDLRPRRNEITVRTAADGSDLKATKTRRERTVTIDDDVSLDDVRLDEARVIELLQTYLAALIYNRAIPVIDERLTRLESPLLAQRRDRELSDFIEALPRQSKATSWRAGPAMRSPRGQKSEELPDSPGSPSTSSAPGTAVRSTWSRHPRTHRSSPSATHHTVGTRPRASGVPPTLLPRMAVSGG